MTDFFYEKQLKILIQSRVKKKPEDVSLAAYLDSIEASLLRGLRSIEEVNEKAPVDDATLKKYWNEVKASYLHTNGSRMGSASFSDNPKFKTWLTDERLQAIAWNYTDRYLELLSQSGRSTDVVEKVKSSSLDILKRMGDPRSVEPFFKKGLAVGEVQSGKTGNFNAVINRALDSGYQLVIVLSGIMEDLRKQTQLRIEGDVIGWGTVNVTKLTRGVKGVGEIKPFGLEGGGAVQQVVSQTSYKSDFNINLWDSGFSLNQTNIIVCKKNASILKNIINTFRDAQHDDRRHQVPFLLLDDEADNASLNNLGSRGREYASKVNGHIRALLDLFDRRTYLGYTATPFANVLQDHNEAPNTGWPIPHKTPAGVEERKFSQVPNLFPDDFIVKLESPTNYVGAKQIFETLEPPDNKLQEKLPILRIVTDDIAHFPVRVRRDSDPPEGVENFQNQADWDARVGQFESCNDFASYSDYRRETRAATVADDFPRRLPGSLKEALQAFILSTAVRESRDAAMRASEHYQPHNTMLIHVSRFMSWQNRTKDLIEEYVKELTSRILNESPGAPGSIYEELRLVWNRHHDKLVRDISGYLREGYTDDYMVPIIFDSVIKFLPQFIEDIDVKAINSGTGDSLEYSKSQPRKVIAIGGNRLSRGFTLEGLTVNYFVRTTNYSDTLFQMGRWFGYRTGFLDCCLLFTTEDALEKFNSTTRCVEELEAELEKHGSHPLSYQLRVRTHPGVLKITRPSILRNTELERGSFQDKLEMTTEFDIRRQKIQNVWNVFLEKVCPMFKPEDADKEFFRADCTGDDILSLLEAENNFKQTDQLLMLEYIRRCQQHGYLTKWKVLIKRTGAAKVSEGKGIMSSSETNLPGDITMAIRRGPRDLDGKGRFRATRTFKATNKSANIMTSPADMAAAVPLTEAIRTQAIQKYRLETEKKLRRDFPDISDDELNAEVERKLQRPPEFVYREAMDDSTGVLIIYLFDSHYVFAQDGDTPDSDLRELVISDDHDLNIPLVGYAMGFPPIKNDPAGQYALRRYELDEEEDEFAEDGDGPEDMFEELGH